METQKIVNLLNGSDNESSKFATRKWHIINYQNNGQYGNGDENGTTVKSSLKQKSLNQIFVITQMHIGGYQNTPIAFKNFASFTKCVKHINDEHVETDENLDIIMLMYNLFEYSDNYADSSGSLWHFKRDPANVTTAGSSSFQYKSNLLKSLLSRDSTANTNPDIANTNRLFPNGKIVVPLKYLSIFFRSLEMPLINCKIHLKLNWTKNFVMSTVGNDVNKTTFKITSTKLYVPIVILSTKDNVNLTKQLNDRFKGSVYWNEYR